MRVAFKILFITLSIIIIYINVRLVAAANKSLKETKRDIALQLQFLETELKQNDAANKMQKLFPEGKVFITTLYGLAWCEFGIADKNKNSVLHTKAINEAIYAYEALNKQECKNTFEPELKPEYGIFYAGWKNYLLAKILILDSTFQNSAIYKAAYIKESENIYKSYVQFNKPYLQSYTQNCWPADNFVAIASLANYSKIIDSKYNPFISQWLDTCKLFLDSNLQLFTHKASFKTAFAEVSCRGSSSSLILRMLAEIDINFAKQQYAIYKTVFLDKHLGLPFVREYPKSTKANADIDSGPVVWDIGFSASLSSLGALGLLDGNKTISKKHLAVIHTFGFAQKNKQSKKYLFGKMPMADAFITWGLCSHLNNKTMNNNKFVHFFEFHILSLILIVIFSYIIFYRLK